MVDLGEGCPGETQSVLVNENNVNDIAFVHQGGSRCTKDPLFVAGCQVGQSFGTTTPNSRGFIFARTSCEDLRARLVVLNYPRVFAGPMELAADIFDTDSSEQEDWAMTGEKEGLLRCVCDKAADAMMKEETQ